MADQASDSIYGIVLLLADEDSRRCINASESLNTVSPSLVKLNHADSRAHVTVVNFKGDFSSAKALWASIAGQVSAMELEVFALYLRPLEGNTWVGFDIRKTFTLGRLHAAAASACQSQNLEIVSEHSDIYWPHITLALWLTLPSQQLPLSEMQFGYLDSATPALALMGEYGEVHEVISTL